MYKRLIERVLYWLSLIFLIGSMYVYIETPQFKWQSLFGTDGLTFFGLLATFISMVLMKFPFFRKIVGAVLLKINWSQLDYRIQIVLATNDADLVIDDMITILHQSINGSELFKTADFEPIRSTSATYKIFHRGMGGTNVLIKRLPEDAEEAFGEVVVKHLWKIEIDGICTFRIMEKNIKFVVNNYLENLTSIKVNPTKISLHILKTNSELLIAENGLALNNNNYKISYSNIQIKSFNTAEIHLDSNQGIYLNSRNKSDFVNALEVFKNIMIS